MVVVLPLAMVRIQERNTMLLDAVEECRINAHTIWKQASGLEPLRYRRAQYATAPIRPSGYRLQAPENSFAGKDRGDCQANPASQERMASRVLQEDLDAMADRAATLTRRCWRRNRAKSVHQRFLDHQGSQE
ncbi:hypothetical protein AAVH_24662 [Aphelenchoides avenae]|nr:hypothetical protein AAVH_24662 [Aphelenchus avenae]